MHDKKDVEEISPTPMPLASLDDSAPLLLDLPDGQQLVLGRLPDGVVIEIATWRGTGRPDSRTNRIMLGVSFDEEYEEVEDEPRKNIIASKLRRPLRKSQPAPVVVEDPVAVAVEEPVANVEEPVAVAVEEPVATVEEPVATVEEPVAIVEAPAVQRFSRQDLFGARPRAQLDEENSSKSIINPDRGYEIVKRGKSMANKKGTAYLLGALKVITPIVTLLVLAAALGLQIVHPQAGLKTSLSSAQGALIIVKSNGTYEIGDNVVAGIEGDQPSPIFAAVAANSEGDYILTANNLYFTAAKEDVKGKVVLVIPGFGYLAGLFD